MNFYLRVILGYCWLLLDNLLLGRWCCWFLPIRCTPGLGLASCLVSFVFFITISNFLANILPPFVLLVTIHLLKVGIFIFFQVVNCVSLFLVSFLEQLFPLFPGDNLL